MSRIIDKLWNWGHLAGSHNSITGFDCKMSPMEFADEYGIKNAFIVSYGGNIQPPFDSTAKELSGLDRIVWSVLGDASTPLPDDELGNTKDILAVLDKAPNIVGGVVDDFFSPERMERFTPEVLKKIKSALNEKGLKFWCVLYNMQLDLDLEKYIECFDGVTFWIWQCENIPHMDEYLSKLFSMTKDTPVMLGVYLMDYCKEFTQMDSKLFDMQLRNYFELLKSKKIEGIVVCSSTVGDAPLETNRILKKYISEYGNIPVD